MTDRGRGPSLPQCRADVPTHPSPEVTDQGPRAPEGTRAVNSPQRRAATQDPWASALAGVQTPLPASLSPSSRNGRVRGSGVAQSELLAVSSASERPSALTSEARQAMQLQTTPALPSLSSSSGFEPQSSPPTRRRDQPSSLEERTPSAASPLSTYRPLGTPAPGRAPGRAPLVASSPFSTHLPGINPHPWSNAGHSREPPLRQQGAGPLVRAGRAPNTETFRHHSSLAMEGSPFPEQASVAFGRPAPAPAPAPEPSSDTRRLLVLHPGHRGSREGRPPSQLGPGLSWGRQGSRHMNQDPNTEHRSSRGAAGRGSGAGSSVARGEQ